MSIFASGHRSGVAPGARALALTLLGGLACDGENVGPAPEPPPTGRLAFESWRDGNWEIYVMDGDGSAQTRLTSDTAYDGQPAWSPDGNRIAFTAVQNGEFAIFLMNTDGSAQTRLTDGTGDQAPAWSPDGAKLAFSTIGGTIYVINADGSARTRLTNNSAYEDQPDWSPRGP